MGKCCSRLDLLRPVGPPGRGVLSLAEVSSGVIPNDHRLVSIKFQLLII